MTIRITGKRTKRSHGLTAPELAEWRATLSGEPPAPKPEAERWREQMREITAAPNAKMPPP